MFESKRLHMIIFSSLVGVSLITLFIVAKVTDNVDTMLTGYLISAIVCIMTIFIRHSLFDRMICGGAINPRDAKNTDQYKNMKFENYFALGFAALFIGCAFLFQLFI